MKVSSVYATDPGLIRSSNQDYYYIDPNGRFFIVADGMGGHAGGEEASRIAAQEIRDYLIANWENSAKSSEELLNEAFIQANEAILCDQETHPERADMGTTAVVVMFRQNDSWCAHVGDSRLYRFRDSNLEQVTQDHTWVARAIEFGDISPDEARIHPFRHVLSRCLGREDLQEIEVQTIDTKIGDRLLLCSDGLTEELMDEKIAHYLQGNSLLDDSVKALVESAKDHGGHDNITIIIVALEENG
ncbi:MAG: Stp1/IreP family PP2C-type Ser/Thr phosphatase [Cyanobacteria bacterium P01_A01_bin.84]